MKKATIQDIAHALNLTPATVSRALNDSSEISEKTKKNVASEANRLNYKRNRIASSLRSGKTNVIGILIPAAEHIFFGSVVRGITNLAAQIGFDVLIYQSNELHHFEEKGIQAFIAAQVDGIIASLAKDSKDYFHFFEVKKRNIPLVFFDRVPKDIKTPSVVIDDYKGAFIATEHLIKQGYKKIAHISGPQHIEAFRKRLLGYSDALTKNKMKFNSTLVLEGDLSIESGKLGTQQLLSLAKPPDAIFTVEDFTALGVLQELKERKMLIPKSFGVFGFCNELFGEHLTPSLSSIDQQTVSMGQEAFKLLSQIINKKVKANSSLQIVLDPIPFFRESSLRKKY